MWNDVCWSYFVVLKTNVPLLSCCNLLIQLKKQGQLSSLFSIPFFPYSRNILEYSLLTTRDVHAFLLSSAVTQGPWLLPDTSALHTPLDFELGWIKKPYSWERRKVTGILLEEAGSIEAREQIKWSHFFLRERF